MSTISTVTDRADGEVLTAAKYNADHGVHEQNATNLNEDKVEIDNFNNEHGPTGAHSAWRQTMPSGSGSSRQTPCSVSGFTAPRKTSQI